MLRSSLYIIVLCSIFILINPAIALADHASPERVVDGKYLVILLLNPEGENMRLRILFRDVETGKNVTQPISYRFIIRQEKNHEPLFESPVLSTTDGAGESVYKFPKGGLYKARLEFWLANEPGKVYRPETWSLWVPGIYNSFLERYPIGPSEIAGFALLGAAIALFLGSIWWNKKTGKPLEIKWPF